jgi:hypothetical protein
LSATLPIVTFAFAVAALVIVLAIGVVRLDERLPEPDRERVDRPHSSIRGVDWASLNVSTRVAYVLVGAGTPKAHHHDHQLHTRQRAERWLQPVPAGTGRHRRPEPPAPRAESSTGQPPFAYPAWYTGTTIPLWITAASEA